MKDLTQINKLVDELNSRIKVDHYSIYLDDSCQYEYIINFTRKLFPDDLNQVCKILDKYHFSSCITADDRCGIIKLKKLDDYEKRVCNFEIKLRSIMLNFDKELDHVDSNNSRYSFIFKDVELNDIMRMGIKEVAKKYKFDLRLININNNLTVEIE